MFSNTYTELKISLKPSLAWETTIILSTSYVSDPISALAYTLEHHLILLQAGHALSVGQPSETAWFYPTVLKANMKDSGNSGKDIF